MREIRIAMIATIDSGVGLSYDNVLVTGGAGFIGSHTVDALLEKGRFEVWVLDNSSTGTERNLRRWKNNRKLHFRKILRAVAN